MGNKSLTPRGLHPVGVHDCAQACADYGGPLRHVWLHLKLYLSSIARSLLLAGLWLLGLQRPHVSHQVRDALLNLCVMTLADAGEERTPHRHVLTAVRGMLSLAAEDRTHVIRGEFSSIRLRQSSQIGGRGS